MEITDNQIKQLWQYIKKHPKSIFNTILGIALVKKDAMKVEEMLYHYVKSAPHDSAANAILGKINEDKNNLSNAELFYKKSLQISPENVYGRIGLLRVLWKQEKKDEYKKEYEQFLAEPDVIVKKLLQSLPNTAIMNIEEAKITNEPEPKEKVSDKTDEDEETYEIEASIGLAKLYKEQGFYKDAISMLKKLIGDDNDEARELLKQWEK